MNANDFNTIIRLYQKEIDSLNKQMLEEKITLEEGTIKVKYLMDSRERIANEFLKDSDWKKDINLRV